MRRPSTITIPTNEGANLADVITNLHYQGISFQVITEDNNYIITLDKLKT
jgi:hypothetical protein